MTTITVTTQDELDAALATHGDDWDAEIIINSPRGVWLNVHTTYSASITAIDSSSVYATGSASVAAYDSARVYATGSVSVTSDDSTNVHVTGSN